jgi:hypothetical protein
MDAAQKESSQILQMTTLGKPWVSTLGIVTEGWVLGKQGGGGWWRRYGMGAWSGHFWQHHPPLARIVDLILWALLFVICGTIRHFYFKRTYLLHGVRTSDHQTPPEPPSIAPLESIRVTTLDPPPPYSQVGLSVPIPNVFHSWLFNMLK